METEPHPERVIIELPAHLADAAAEWIAAAIAAAVSALGRCAIALAGGNTPRAVYERLARDAAAIPWPRVHAYFGDERCVPPVSAESNFRMAEESLLGRVPIPAENIHRMRGEAPDADAAAREYAALLPERLDVLLLGLGPDGHTASLFPGAPALDERTRTVVSAASPVPPPHRLTITPPVITAARRTAVIAAGAGKAAIVRRALEGPFDPHVLPVQFARGARWFLDRDAARELAQVGA